jgi:hypothetical protein
MQPHGWGIGRKVLNAVIAGFAVGAVAAPAVASASPIDLGAVNFATVAIDANHQHVLVSTPSGNQVDVLSYSGALVQRITGISGAYGMWVGDRYAFVAASTTGAIMRIDLSNLSAAPVVFAKGLADPRWLVVSGGRMWVAQQHPYDDQGSLAAINNTTGAVTQYPTPTYYYPDLATSPGAPNSLFLEEDGITPAPFYRLSVAGGAPAQVAANTQTPLDGASDFAVSPDGTGVVSNGGEPGGRYNFYELNASTLQPDGFDYPGQTYPSAISFSSSAGGRVATGLAGFYSTPDVVVYRIGSTTPIFTATTTDPSGYHDVDSHGLALSPDGHTLAVVYTDEGQAGHLFAEVLAVP